jgi:hypothetical protein
MTILEQGKRFIWRHGRLLERAVMAHLLEGEAPGRVALALRAYQNLDGGLGHALEPDLRAPESQPLYLEFGLRTLYDCGLRAPDLAQGACIFLSQHADLEAGIPTLFPSALAYDHAPHWEAPSAREPSLDRLISLVGLLNWQRIEHPWLERAVGACLAHLARLPMEDAHTIQNGFCLLESVAETRDVSALFDRLADELTRASFFLAEAPISGYGLTPLHLAPTPDSYLRRLFGQEQIEAHLDDLLAQQQPDGGWPIAWEPPGETAALAWRAHRTLAALTTLRAYGRI